MPSIFLSAARADHQIADLVEERLRERFQVFRESAAEIDQSPNRTVIVDPRETARLQSQLDSADLVVVLWSINSARSEWVKREMDRALYAWSESKLVLVKLDQTPLPPGLRDLRAIDLSGRIEQTLRPPWSNLSRHCGSRRLMNPFPFPRRGVSRRRTQHPYLVWLLLSSASLRAPLLLASLLAPSFSWYS